MFSHRKKRALACAMIYMEMMASTGVRKLRSKWVKSYLLKKQQFSHTPLLKELRENDPSDFKNYLRMDVQTYDLLLGLVRESLTKQDTPMREAITPEERLTATLRFLATGRSYEDLKYSVGISAQALGYIIPETCAVIFNTLKADYMKFPKSKEQWVEVASQFEDRWQFMNCGGALDGKHIRIVPPPKSGALYYNYKKFYSVVLMALVNSNYEFMYVDVGKQGRMSDGGVIEWTSFHQKLVEDKLNLPNTSETKENLNFVLLGDAAFGLHEHILTPYPEKSLDYHQRIYNYRLSRARNVVENAFGVLAARFRMFHTALAMAPENINVIVLAACVLHNFLQRNSKTYVTRTTFDNENSKTHAMEKGDWRQEGPELIGLQRRKKNSSLSAKTNRLKYCQYFNNVRGRVQWQDEMLQAGKA